MSKPVNEHDHCAPRLLYYEPGITACCLTGNRDTDHSEIIALRVGSILDRHSRNQNCSGSSRGPDVELFGHATDRTKTLAGCSTGGESVGKRATHVGNAVSPVDCYHLDKRTP